MIRPQDVIPRYSETCAAFSCGRPRRYLRNPRNPWSNSFRFSDFAWCFYSGGSRLHQYTIASTAPTITKGPDEGSGTGVGETDAIWPKAEFPRTNRTRNARTHPTPLGRANLPQIRGDCMPFWEHSACRGEPAPGVERNGALSRNGRPALSYFGTPEKPENLTWRSQKQKQRSTADYPDFADALSEGRL